MLLISRMCNLGFPSKASRIAPLDATCPNVFQGLTSWNFKTVFLVDSKEHVLSDAEAKVR